MDPNMLQYLQTQAAYMLLLQQQPMPFPFVAPQSVPSQPSVRPVNNPWYKTRLCENFQPGGRGQCPYGKRCTYVHPTDREYAAYRARLDARSREQVRRFQEDLDVLSWKAMFDEVPDAPRPARDDATSDASGAGGDEEKKSVRSSTDFRMAASLPPVRALTNRKYKTKLCTTCFAPDATGVCPYGESCIYIHPTDLEYAAYRAGVQRRLSQLHADANLAPESRAAIDKHRQVLSWKAMFDEVPDAKSAGGDEEKKSVRSSTDFRMSASQLGPDAPRQSDASGAAEDAEKKSVHSSTGSSDDTHFRTAATPLPTRQARVRKNRYLNTVLCKNFEPGASGVCPFAERCWYIHPTDHAHAAYKKAHVHRQLSQSTSYEVPDAPHDARDSASSDASGAAGDEEKKSVRPSTDSSSLPHHPPLESLLQRALSNRASELQSELQQQMDRMASQLCGILGISHTPTPLVLSTTLGEPAAAEHEKKMCKKMVRVETGVCDLGERCKDAHPRSDREDAAYREWCAEALERARADFARFSTRLEEPSVESEVVAASVSSARVAPPESNDRSCIKCEFHRKVASAIDAPPLQRRVLPRAPTASTVNRMLPTDANTMSAPDRSAFFASLRESLQPRRRFSSDLTEDFHSLQGDPAHDRE